MAGDETHNPACRVVVDVPVPMRVPNQFTKLGGHLAEIKERRITSFEALEWMEFIDGNVSETRMYDGTRVPFYAQELQAQVDVLLTHSWIPAAVDEASQ